MTDSTPVSDVISWDADGFDGVFCDTDTYNLVNAAFCHEDETIGWDRDVLLPSPRRANGDMAVTMVLAHEYGHAVQQQARGWSPGRPRPLVSEQQADLVRPGSTCAGSPKEPAAISLSTGDGLNNLPAAMIAFGDRAAQRGRFRGGRGRTSARRSNGYRPSSSGSPTVLGSCATMDPAEIKQRRGDLPVLLPENQSGELQITEDSVRSIMGAMEVLFEPAEPPELTFEPHACPDADSDAPATFCPATNTIAVDLPALEMLGAQSDDEDTGLVTGDNTGYSVLVSRYMQSIQHQRGGVALNTAQAAAAHRVPDRCRDRQDGR